MNPIEPNLTVGEMVREKPSRSRVFAQFGIDFCCGGKVSLARACEKRGLTLERVLARLGESDALSNDDTLIDADTMSLTELCDHIEATHHAYLKEELPRLDQMTEKVARVHGDKEPKLVDVRQVFIELRAELEPHMNPIRQMEQEHDHAGDALARIRTATDGFVPPPWACNTYRGMLDGLRQLEENMHQHVHKENNVMFPKATELEARLASSHSPFEPCM